MTRILAAVLGAALALSALPAGAQSRLTRTERLAEVEGRSIGSQIQAPGLPGVALDGNAQTERPSGPGGLSNGVGSTGTLMPNSSSSNGQLLNDEGNGFGIPIDSRYR